MKRLVLLLILSSILSCSSNTTGPSANEGQFVKESIASDTVLTLHSHESYLFAGTGDGVFKKSIDEPESSWSLSGLSLDRSSVVDFVSLNESEILAAVLYDNVQTQEPTLFRSMDTGTTWNDVEATVPEEVSNFSIKHLEDNRGNPMTIYADVGIIIQSSDGGRNWQIIYESVGFTEFLHISPNHPDQIWSGGWTPIFSPYLTKSEDGGENWKILSNQIYDQGDATSYTVVAHPESRDEVLAGLGGSVAPANIIRKSIDGGQNWDTVLENIHTRTLAHGAQNPETVYASGRNPDGEVFFAKSTDFGDSWTIEIFDEGPTGVTINDLKAIERDGREVLFLATDNGLYCYAF